jgi:hypothetical protein
MIISTILGFLLGVFFGLRFGVFTLLPPMLVGGAMAIFSLAFSGGGWSVVAPAFLLGCLSIQIGYVIGRLAATRFSSGHRLQRCAQNEVPSCTASHPRQH